MKKKNAHQNFTGSSKLIPENLGVEKLDIKDTMFFGDGILTTTGDLAWIVNHARKPCTFETEKKALRFNYSRSSQSMNLQSQMHAISFFDLERELIFMRQLKSWTNRRRSCSTIWESMTLLRGSFKISRIILSTVSRMIICL